MAGGGRRLQKAQKGHSLPGPLPESQLVVRIPSLTAIELGRRALIPHCSLLDGRQVALLHALPVNQVVDEAAQHAGARGAQVASVDPLLQRPTAMQSHATAANSYDPSPERPRPLSPAAHLEMKSGRRF